MNTIHYSAITTAAAHIWTGARQSPRFRGQADVSERLNTLFRRCFQRLQSLLADIDARAISSVLWSSATLSFKPDDAMQGMVQALTSKFLQLVVVEQKKQRPNAHDVAHMMWAFATMGHPAATAQVVGAICLQFGRIVRSPVAQLRPKAQAVANLMWALGTLMHTPLDDRLLSHLCTYMHTLLRNQDERVHPNAQACAHVLWALARMGHSSAAAMKMVDAMCLHFARLVSAPTAQHRPTAQQVAKFVWALGTLKHAPSHDTVTAMFDHLVDLCHTPGLQPNTQDISNSFKACSELRLHLKPTCVEALLKRFMEMHISSVNYQDCCNLAWSLAVMQCLDLNTFEALLDKMATKYKLSVQESAPQSTSAQLTAAGARQLYQALTWLGLPSGSEQTKAWSSLRLWLLAVAPDPAVTKLSSPKKTMMWAALAMHQVPYKAQVRPGVYWADALLSPINSEVAEVILMVERPRYFIKNMPNR